MYFTKSLFTILTAATAVTSTVFFLQAIKLGGGMETVQLCFWGGVWAFVTFALGFLAAKIHVCS